MLLSPCRFKLPLTDNAGQPIEARVILELHRELLASYEGFTIHPTAQGRWQSRAGKLYREEVIVYEVAVPKRKVQNLKETVCWLGRRLGQLAMYFDAPAPSVEIINLAPNSKQGVGTDEAGNVKTTRRRSKNDRRPS